MIMIGNSNVGKTALMMRYFDDVFADNPMATNGVATKFMNTTVLDKPVRL